ncbi:MAG TPA: hypothetical protein VGM03_06825, partial [Phycisphaerae bacterium]
VRCAKSRDYGIIQLSVNDRKSAQPVDCYNPEITVAPEIDLGIFDLKPGENRLTAEVVGANDAAVKQYMFGLDYVRLQPVP